MAICSVQSSYIVPDQTRHIELMVGQLLEGICGNLIKGNLELAGDTEIDQILRAKLGSVQIRDVQSSSD